MSQFAELTRIRLRNAVLDVAYDAVLAHGWASTRMADIAHRVGVSRQTLYNEFGNKELLAQALTLRETERFLEGVADVLRSQPDPVEALAAAIRFTLNEGAENPLIKAILTSDPREDLLPLLTTRAEPLLRAARDIMVAHLVDRLPDLSFACTGLVAEAGIRLAMSHLIVPLDPADVAAERIATLLAAAIRAPGALPERHRLSHWERPMSTLKRYEIPEAFRTWELPSTGDTRFTWEYEDGRERLLALYQKGKDKQWDSAKRIDWSLDVDPNNPLGLPEETIPIYGSETWDKIKNDQKVVDEVSRHASCWQFSQFLHGEQGAMICSAKIVETVPDLDSKFYAATQTMDEARHAETYARFLQEKVGLIYPINPYLKSLLDDTLSESRWDFPYLGMQVLIEGLALAAFGMLRDLTTSPLAKQILAYVMQDEARHVAFGRMALKDYYAELSQAELRDREDFVIEGCYLMRNRFRQEEVWRNLGFNVRDCLMAVENAPTMRLFRSLLFSRIVPCVKDIGLWSERIQSAYDDMGVLDMAGLSIDDLMRADEAIADKVDAERRELAVRKREVDEIIAIGTQA